MKSLCRNSYTKFKIEPVGINIYLEENRHVIVMESHQKKRRVNHKNLCRTPALIAVSLATGQTQVRIFGVSFYDGDMSPFLQISD
jgi:hypothetical protein